MTNLRTSTSACIDATTQSIKSATDQTLHRLPQTLTAALAGGLGFVWVQSLTGTTNIAEFVGQKIVEIGHYDAALASPIGWTVHLAIAVQYAIGFAFLLSLPIWPTRPIARVTAKIAAAIAVGFIGTWVANPAISVTVSLLGGAGLPSTLYPVNTAFGVPLLNHLLFFALTLAATDGLSSVARRLHRFNPVDFRVRGEETSIDDSILFVPRRA